MTPRQQQLDQIGQIEQIADDSQRWRAIQRFMFSINPQLVEDDRIHIATTKEIRDQQMSRTGATKSGSMRQLYSMPEYLYRALQVMDPVFDRSQNSKDPAANKRFNHKIWRAFPEYRIASKI